ncbi:hypothetical protein J8J21_22770, partial [Mycobacterium tuberculosis]|nr:hypothetical protein [Mycobacterium tuberculosis]
KGLITGLLEERIIFSHQLKLSSDGKLDFSKLVSELTEIENELEDSSSRAASLDVELFGVLGKKLRLLYENQKLAQAM